MRWNPTQILISLGFPTCPFVPAPYKVQAQARTILFPSLAEAATPRIERAMPPRALATTTMEILVGCLSAFQNPLPSFVVR